METKSKITVLNILAILFKFGFWLHLAVVVFLTTVNFIMKNESGWYLTARGNAKLAEQHWEPTPVQLKDTVGQSAILLIGNSAFARIDYTDISKAFQSKAIWVIIADVLYLWVWLLITYSIMKILSSIKNQQIFELRNINRIRFIALITAIIWLVQILRDFWFAKLLNENIQLNAHLFYSNTNLNVVHIFYGVAPMLFLLLLAEIFAYGLQLKQENDLTI